MNWRNWNTRSKMSEDEKRLQVEIYSTILLLYTYIERCSVIVTDLEYPDSTPNLELAQRIMRETLYDGFFAS